MELFIGNWLILSHSSSTAGGESHWPMNSLHLRPDCVSLGCSLEKTIRFAGAKHGHHGGWEWDAEKEEMASDSTAAWRLVCHTSQVWHQYIYGKISAPNKRRQTPAADQSSLWWECFVSKANISYLTETLALSEAYSLEVEKLHEAKMHLKIVFNDSYRTSQAEEFIIRMWSVWVHNST